MGYLGRTIEFPYVMSDGKTISACAASVLDATQLAVATMLEAGEQPPAPACDLKRDQQLNIRLSREERMRIESVARRAGYRSVSDFVRAAALRQSA